MKRILTAVALSIAPPALAHAQTAPAQGKMACCEKMKAEGKDCCCMRMGGSHGEHSGKHGESKPPQQPNADQHQNHQH